MRTPHRGVRIGEAPGPAALEIRGLAGFRTSGDLFLCSRPGTRLLWATLGVVATTLVVPFLPVAPLLGLTPLPLPFLGLVAVIVAMYIISGELAKRIFYRHFEPTRAGNA